MADMYKVRVIDFAKGAATAAMAAFLFAAWPIISGVFNTPGFDVFHAEWGVILTQALNAGINAAVAAFTSYITVNFFTNSDGKLFGSIKIR